MEWNDPWFVAYRDKAVAGSKAIGICEFLVGHADYHISDFTRAAMREAIADWHAAHEKCEAVNRKSAA